MSIVKFGDLLNVSEGIILHQVNYQSHMGGGIAKQLSSKYQNLLPEYCNFIKDMKNEFGNSWRTMIMGQVFYTSVDQDLVVGNCFSQVEEPIRGSITSYDAMIRCFDNVREVFPQDKVYVPFGMGCGIAGGNWNIVKEIIEDFNFEIVARPSDYEMWLNK